MRTAPRIVSELLVEKSSSTKSRTNPVHSGTCLLSDENPRQIHALSLGVEGGTDVRLRRCRQQLHHSKRP